MAKTFKVDGYAVNGRGHTVGIHYTIPASCKGVALTTGQQLAEKGGYKHIRITSVERVKKNG